jgi:hypothetical protein
VWWFLFRDRLVRRPRDSLLEWKLGLELGLPELSGPSDVVRGLLFCPPIHISVFVASPAPHGGALWQSAKSIRCSEKPTTRYLQPNNHAAN